MEQNGFSRFADAETAEKFYILTERLREFNRNTNITAIKSTEDCIVKHYADSLSAEEFVPKGASVIDIGCGGGFPSIPLALVRDDIKVLSVDSVGKKLAFVELIKKEFGLEGLGLKNCRAEELAKDPAHREKYGAVTARAVASLNVLSELCLPFAKKGAPFIAMKGRNAEDELSSSLSAIEKLGGRLAKTVPVPLKNGEERYEHNIIIIEKIKNTDGKYPRAYGQIVRKPL